MRQLISTWFGLETRCPARTRQAFTPQLESLGDRLCPSGVSLKGQTLSEVGSDFADRVTIIQNDAARTVTVEFNGQQSEYASADITKIKVDLKGGGDRLAYAVDASSGYYFAKQLTINTGDGNDDVELNVVANIAANLAITVNTGADNDQLSAKFGPKAGGKLSLKAVMGAGSDAADVYFAGATNNAQAKISVDGGAGADAIDFRGVLTGSDSGKLTASVNGGADNDRVIFGLSDASLGRVKVATKVAGGRGQDTGTSNVKATGIEQTLSTPFSGPDFDATSANSNIDLFGGQQLRFVEA